MSKATNRKLRRQLERKARQRQAEEAREREQLLKGFRTASPGDMLREISRQPQIQMRRPQS